MAVHHWYSQLTHQNIHPTWPLMSDSLQEFKKYHFHTEEDEPKKDYISVSTWELIKQKRDLLIQKQTQPQQKAELTHKITTLKKQITKAARKDRTDAADKWITEDLPINEQWKGIAKIKKDYQPKRYAIKNHKETRSPYEHKPTLWQNI